MIADFHCRACGANAGKLILDLGEQPLANNLLRPEDLAKPEPCFPLRLVVWELVEWSRIRVRISMEDSRNW